MPIPVVLAKVNRHMELYFGSSRPGGGEVQSRGGGLGGIRWKMAPSRAPRRDLTPTVCGTCIAGHGSGLGLVLGKRENWGQNSSA